MGNGRSIKRNLGKEEQPKKDSNVFIQELIQDVPPEKMKQLETSMGAITQMVFDPKTKSGVVQMLKSGEGNIEQTFPMAVNAVFKQFEDMYNMKQNNKMPLDVKLALGVHTFQEVQALAASSGVMPEMDLTEAQPLLKATLQQYIQTGLKEKTIDPIELQENVNPLLTEAERGEGLAMAEQHGIPTELMQQQKTDGLLNSRMQPLKVKQAELQKENESLKGALQGVSQRGA